MAEFLTNLNERNARQLCNTYCLMDVTYFLKSTWWYIWFTSLASATCSFLNLTKTSTMSLPNLGLCSDSPLHQEPGQTGVDRGKSLAWKPGWARLVAGVWPCWQRDKKTGEAAVAGPARPGLAAVGRGQNWEGKAKNINGLHGLDRPRLAGVKTGKAWQGKAEKFGLQLACTSHSWWGQKLVKLAKKPWPAWPRSNYRACILVQGLPWVVSLIECAPPKLSLKPQKLALLLIWLL